MYAIFLTFSFSFYEPLHLNDQTFKDQILEVPLSFVLATRDNSPSFRSVLQKFRAVGEFLRDKCQFIILEYSTSSIIREKYRISSFPSLLVFREDRLVAEYTGELRAPRILAYLKRLIGPPIIPLLNTRATVYLLRDNPAVVIGIGPIGPSATSAFQTVAEELRDLLPFASANHSSSPSLQLRRRDDRAIIEFPLDSTLTADSLRKWVLANWIPRYRAKSPSVWRNAVVDGRFTFLAFANTSSQKSMDLIHETMDRIVNEFGDILNYIYGDIQESAAIVESFGFTGKIDPVYCIAKVSESEITEKFPFPESSEGNVSEIVEFVREFINLNGTGKMKSEETTENQDGPVFKLTGREFRDVTADPGLDVVVVVLVGSKESREAALRTAEIAGRELERQKVTKVKFYSIDGKLNDIPGIVGNEWKESFVVLWPAGVDKKAMYFPPKIAVAELMSQIRRHGKTKPKFKIPRGFKDIGL
jgi:hypothetical protein